MALSLQDRIDSIKSGLIGASIVGAVAALCEVLNGIATQTLETTLRTVLTPVVPILVSILFAGISGFLFGVTYRYIRRRDPNPHLRTGAIAAFGLVRGLAQIDVGLLAQEKMSLIFLMAGESLAMMAIAAIGLDWAMDHHWIRRAP